MAAAPLLLPGISFAATSCAEIHTSNPAAGDGSYTLGIGDQRVDVFCHDMAGTPREYVVLPHTGSTTNYSYYGQGPNTSADGLTTWFSQVRLDPATLTLLLDDTTFSTSQGWIWFDTGYQYSRALGIAADCVMPESDSGRSNIDLTGTPFDIVPDQFHLVGAWPAGSAIFSSPQSVNLKGGGYCGGISTLDNRLRVNLRSAPEPNADLVHSYSFSTSAADSVGGAHGTLQGGAKTANGEVVLNGSSSYVSLPIGNTLSQLQDATFEAWVQWNGEPGTEANIFNVEGAASSYLSLRATRQGTPLFVINSAQGDKLSVESPYKPFPAGVLTHVVVTIDHMTQITRLYINGLEVARSSSPLTPATLGAASNSTLGYSMYGEDPFFKGSISEFRVYRTALSPTQIAARFDAKDTPRVLETSISEQPANPSNQGSASFLFSGNGTQLHYLCSLDGNTFGACTSPFTIEPLSEGLHTFQVKAHDTMGNMEAMPSSFSWRVDLTPPETRFDSTPAPETRVQAPSFSFSSSEPRSTFECSLDQAPFSECPGVFPALADGPHRLSVRAIDEATNVDPDPARYSWTVDTAAPQEPSFEVPAPGQTLFTDRPSFSGKAEPGITLRLFIDGVEADPVETNDQGFWRILPASPLPWGKHRVTAVASDRAGNTSPLAIEVHFSTSQRGAYGLNCAATSSSWRGSSPWALLLIGLLYTRRRPFH
ncbi:LamG-like jellyroll fold domain-containing protein [Hyalangium versicolor]|uniref:LamG-like jellyroll fold domain-containing protein n=1 Tax=Hyalangium versicolor TaxID=2861190 RepID=UPI001CCEE01A|nr:LamG-like jellyroll fold domain-containing protein [Hyalangium versicolor]